jgi:hypothetical protein
VYPNDSKWQIKEKQLRTNSLQNVGPDQSKKPGFGCSFGDIINRLSRNNILHRSLQRADITYHTILIFLNDKKKRNKKRINIDKFYFNIKNLNNHS